MDLEEWEYLSDDGFIDQLHRQDGSGKRVISRENPDLYPNSEIDMNYFQKFIDPESKGAVDVDQTRNPPNFVIPVPVEFDLTAPASPTSLSPDDSVVKEVISPENPPILNLAGGLESEGDKETVSRQVFFKKTRENEFADMKLDSPKSANRGFVPQIDFSKPQFQEEEDFEDGIKSPSSGVVSDCKENFADPDPNEWESENDHGGLNIWKMGMTGIGALCSFGFACATICVIAFGSRHREKHQDQKLHFQIYADEKRMKQVVHHASKLNEAISAARGAPLRRAQITIGGYFEGL